MRNAVIATRIKSASTACAAASRFYSTLTPPLPAPRQARPSGHGALERFLTHLESEGRSHHTIRQYLRHVRLLATWATDTGHSGRLAEITNQDVGKRRRRA